MTRYCAWGVLTIPHPDGGPCLIEHWSSRRDDGTDRFYFKTHCNRNLEIIKPAGTSIEEVAVFDAVPLCLACIATTHHLPKEAHE